MALDLAAQAEHGEGSLVVAVSDDAALLDALGGVAVAVHADSMDAALAFAEALAPEHLQLAGARRRRRWRRACAAPAACSSGSETGTAFGDYVAGSNHTLPTGGAARFASGLNVRHFRRRMAEVRLGRRGGRAGARRGADRARRGLRAARRLDGRSLRQSRPVSDRTAQIERRTGETNVSLPLGLDGTGAGTRRHRASASSTTCSTCWPATAGWTSRCRSTGDLQTGSHHTVEDTGIVLGQALDRALGDRRGIVRYGHAVIPMDEARAACAIDVSGRPFCAVEGFDRLPAGDIAGFEHEAAEEFFRAVASAARLTLHIDLQAGTNAHHMIEACFKALARALRAAVADRSDRDRRAVHQGRPVIAICDYGMGNRRSVEKALEHVGAEPVITSEPDVLRSADGVILPGVGAFPEAMRNVARAGAGGGAARARRRRAAARRLPRPAAAVRALERARGRRPASACCPAR